MAPPSSTDVDMRRSNKRKRANDTNEQEKKEIRKRCFKDEDSIREQARNHRILTARKNRRLDVKHMQTLCTIFAQGGLNQKAEENHLLVLCSRADVSRMMDHLRRQGQPDSLEASEELPFFKEWLSVNRGSLVEIMAGQHRVKALEAYVRKTGAAEEELWWTCELYDRDLAMADSHGQVWMQVVAASSQDPKLFRGKAAEVEEQMIDILQLGSEKLFPTRRLAMIWRNERWREMATCWCETSIGRATFKISAWDWMISYRIDDYWFMAFRSVLQTLSQLPGDAANDVELSDWKKMSDSLGLIHTDDQVRRLFYPIILLSAAAAIKSTIKRQPGFLSAMDDLGYYEVCKRIASTRQLRFPNIHHIISLTKEEGKVLFQVMSHVVAWLNATPTTIINRRDNNKPPLRADLATTLEHCSDKIVRAAEKRLGTFSASILLQHEVLDFVLQHLAEFRSPVVKPYLEQAPKEVDVAQYTKRFSHEMWSEVLTIVQRWVGHDFHSEWMYLTESLRTIIKDDPELGADAAFLGKLSSKAFEVALSGWFARQQGYHHHHRQNPDTRSHHGPGGKSMPATLNSWLLSVEADPLCPKKHSLAPVPCHSPTLLFAAMPSQPII
ncbi:hypothetical protein LCI18_000839 [Fusarium solani-melongenae]|uniref:Uncharacterized protein n=1 Tax=Fusarium solani subsp. cucurbitae TaxID=2747967 RepID=A0ACD3YLX1_FUSSC|nr:hypothetical protein LCI18_000839 [Fusarium solani-melongenae]